MEKRVPDIIFIIPYRDRPQHRRFFENYIGIVMSDYARNKWDFYFSHQTDTRPFNRGATKNIGFIAMKKKYPNDYKNITFVFNDIDILPYDKGILNYDTEHGVIKHFYGFNFALGGCFSIKGSDFEKLNGFPNYWAWGQEDNCIYNRSLKKKIPVNRKNFFKIGHSNILQMFDGLERTIMKGDISRTVNDNGNDGIVTISDLDINIVDHDILIKDFEVPRKYSDERYERYSIIKKNKKNPIGLIGKMYNF